MDQFIKNSIDARYNAFTSSYVINDDLKKKIDDLFKKINESFGSFLLIVYFCSQ